MPSIPELQERLNEIHEQESNILMLAEGEKRDLSEEEQESLDALLSEFDAKSQDLARMQKIEEQGVMLSGRSGRRTEPEKPRTGPDDEDGDDEPQMKGRKKPEPRITVRTDRGRGGFRSMGEFASCVVMACHPAHGVIDPRLAPTVYGNENVGADGGFAVPPDFREQIMSQVMGEDSLLARTDQFVTGSNAVTVPVDLTTPWQSTGGLQAYWTAEGAQKTQSKPVLDQITVKLHKLAALVPMTDELVEDAPAMETYLRRKVPEKIEYKINEAIIRGSGAGQPLGILNSGALISVAKEGSQLADTVVGANIIKMHARMNPQSVNRAVWLVNPEVLPEIHRLSLPGRDNTGLEVTGWGTQLYIPPGGLSDAPFGTLMGRPIIVTQATSQLGDLGDIIFADLSQYLTATKGGIRAETSIHLWFDYDITAFRFVIRIAGQPWWASTISPRNGSFTLSPFVALAERA